MKYRGRNTLAYETSIILIQKYYTKRYLSWTQIQKNTQPNISKSNLLTYENDNTSQPSEAYLDNARLTQHLKINQCNSCN